MVEAIVAIGFTLDINHVPAVFNTGSAAFTAVTAPAILSPPYCLPSNLINA